MQGDILRIKLEGALKEKYPDYLSIREVEDICRSVGRKLSNGERRFRHDYRNNEKAEKFYIPHEKVWNEKRTAIIGYRWIPDEVEASWSAIKEKPKQDRLFTPGRVIN